MKDKSSNIKKTKKTWPTRAAMQQVYAMKLWGENDDAFYSGDGSHLPELVVPYVKVVKSFLTSFKRSLVVCDLGCGDFNVGKELVGYTKNYIAVDIVPKLIAHNKKHFNEMNVAFHCLDISQDAIPAGDCAILRQVLQHLSNGEVQHVLNKLAPFKYVILTEHLPVGDFLPNEDIISGQGTRLKKGSGLNVLAPPFNFQINEEKQILSVLSNDGKGIIVTTLYTLF